MSKTLSTILTIFKIAGIVAKVIFILCIIGCIGCLIALFAIPFLGSLLPLGIFTEQELQQLSAAYPSCIIGALTCAGEAVCAFFAEKYFKNVQSSGTPFTFDGAKECLHLGCVSIIVSFAVSLAAGIILAIMSLMSMDASQADIEISASLTSGLFLIFLSFIFKYGAELQQTDTQSSSQEE